MNTNEITEKYKKEICPYCIHYKNKDYKECSVVVTIDGQANCINCKCIEYDRKIKKGEKYANKSEKN